MKEWQDQHSEKKNKESDLPAWMRFTGTNGLFNEKFKSSREKKSDKGKKVIDKSSRRRGSIFSAGISKTALGQMRQAASVRLRL